MKLGLIGCGKMGGALLEGVINAKLVNPADVSVCDAYPAAAQGLKQKHPRLKILANAVKVVAASEVVIIAVKPKDMQPLLEGLAKLDGERLYISIAAGITLTQMQAWLGGRPRIIRVMPNTPAQIGRGYSAFARPYGVSDHDADTARQIFGSLGLVDEVPENLLDAITGLSGSGPA